MHEYANAVSHQSPHLRLQRTAVWFAGKTLMQMLTCLHSGKSTMQQAGSQRRSRRTLRVSAIRMPVYSKSSVVVAALMFAALIVCRMSFPPDPRHRSVG